MNDDQIIEILDSWVISGEGIIAELKYGKGIPQGSHLISKTGKQWAIKGRLIFNHTANEQKRFPKEIEISMFLIFESIDALEKSKMKILEKEKHGIYQYKLIPEGHNEKPIMSEKTIIMIN